MFCKFYLVKKHKIANNPTTAEATGKKLHRFVRILAISYAGLTKFQHNLILLHKIIHNVPLMRPSLANTLA